MGAATLYQYITGAVGRRTGQRRDTRLLAPCTSIRLAYRHVVTPSCANRIKSRSSDLQRYCCNIFSARALPVGKQLRGAYGIRSYHRY